MRGREEKRARLLGKFKTVSSLSFVAVNRKELQMLYSALVFLLVGLIAVGLGVAGVTVVSAQVSWTIFLIGAALLAIQLVMLAMGRTVRVR